jgi:hypothetical protein
MKAKPFLPTKIQLRFLSTRILLFLKAELLPWMFHQRLPELQHQLLQLLLIEFLVPQFLT